MNTHTLQGSWSEIKGKIKAKFSKLNDGEVESLKDNLDQLTAKVQKAYQYTGDQAERETQEFRKSLQTAGQEQAGLKDQAKNQTPIHSAGFSPSIAPGKNQEGQGKEAVTPMTHSSADPASSPKSA